MKFHAGWWLVFLFMFSGCSVVNQSSMTPPGVDLSGIEKIHVKWHEGDGRKINVVIKEQLLKMGFTATTDPVKPTANEVDAYLTYSDRWFWDITMYMLQLTIYIKDPNSDFILGAGKSYRTSLARGTPEFMAQEVLESIFGPRRKENWE